MDSQYKLLSELLSDQAAFITSPKTSLANYWGALPPCPPVSTGQPTTKILPVLFNHLLGVPFSYGRKACKNNNNNNKDI